MQSQLASNESSAIIATVDSVEESALSVFSYSLDKYVPSHAFQKIAIDAINGSTNQKKSGTLVYNLPKIAWLRSMYLEFDVTWTVPEWNGVGAPPLANASTIVPGPIGWLKMIEKITFESATRELYVLTREAIQCMISDLSAEAQIAVGQNLHSTFDPLEGNGAVGDPIADLTKLGISSNERDGYVHVSIPLLFCTQYITKLCPALQFWESSRVTVNLSSDWTFPGQVCGFLGTAPNVVGSITPVGPNDIGITNSQLLCTFLQLPLEQEQAVIADNYSAGNLTSLTFNTERLQSVLFTTARAELPQPIVTVPIKSTRVISAIYLIVEAIAPGAAFDVTDDNRSQFVGLNAPLPVAWITFEANGEKIINQVPAHQFSGYARPTMSGDHGGIFATNPQGGCYTERISALGPPPYKPILGNISRDGMNNAYVYKIDIGQLSSNKTFSSGYLSLRELSNPRISFQMAQQVSNNTASSVFYQRNVDIVPFELFENDVNPGASMKATVVVQTGALTTINGSDGRVLNVLSN